MISSYIIVATVVSKNNLYSARVICRLKVVAVVIILVKVIFILVIVVIAAAAGLAVVENVLH